MKFEINEYTRQMILADNRNFLYQKLIEVFIEDANGYRLNLVKFTVDAGLQDLYIDRGHEGFNFLEWLRDQNVILDEGSNTTRNFKIAGLVEGFIVQVYVDAHEHIFISGWEKQNGESTMYSILYKCVEGEWKHLFANSEEKAKLAIFNIFEPGLLFQVTKLGAEPEVIDAYVVINGYGEMNLHFLE